MPDTNPACAFDFSPVCADGVTYGNACLAIAACQLLSAFGFACLATVKPIEETLQLKRGKKND